MNEQSLELRLLRAVETLPSAMPDETLVKLWDETERVIVARIPLNPAPRRVEPQERAERVRFTYD